MSDPFGTLVAPLETLIAWPLAAAHQLAVSAGLSPGPAWAGAIAALVVVVRLALLPVVVRQVRIAHAGARARPVITEITARYAGRTDPESVRAQLAEIQAARAEHGASLGCLPALAQGAVLFGLYRLLTDLAAGRAVGAMSSELVASARSAQLGGVSLPDLMSTLGPSGAGVAVAALALGAAAANFVTIRWISRPNLPDDALTGPAARLTGVLPWVAAIGLAVSAPLVPAGVLAYWFVSSLWTAAQTAAVVRWAPTPGTAAYRRRHPKD